MVLLDGRKIIMDSEEGSSGKYRSSALKKTFAFNEKGEIVPVDSLLHLLTVYTYSFLHYLINEPSKIIIIT
jgi:hypothetical protein